MRFIKWLGRLLQTQGLLSNKFEKKFISGRPNYEEITKVPPLSWLKLRKISQPNNQQLLQSAWGEAYLAESVLCVWAVLYQWGKLADVISDISDTGPWGWWDTDTSHWCQLTSIDTSFWLQQWWLSTAKCSLWYKSTCCYQYFSFPSASLSLPFLLRGPATNLKLKKDFL